MSNLPMLSPNITTALNALSVFGEIAQSYARTLAYKAEIKKLDVELASINRQAELMHKKIDTEYNVKMKQLEIQRSALAAAFTMANHRLHNQHLEKMKLLGMAENLQNHALKTKNSDERKQLLGMSQEMISNAMQLSNQSAISLNNLIAQLPTVNYQQLGVK